MPFNVLFVKCCGVSVMSIELLHFRVRGLMNQT